MEKPAHYFDQTEMDLEHGSLEPASRYHRPHGIQAYDYDKTTVDLARPRMALPAEALPPASPASTDSPPQSPLPGGDR